AYDRKNGKENEVLSAAAPELPWDPPKQPQETEGSGTLSAGEPAGRKTVPGEDMPGKIPVSAKETGENGTAGSEKTSGSSRKSGKSRKDDEGTRPADLLYGRNFEGDSTEIAQLDEASGNVIIRGQILSAEGRELRNEKRLLSVSLTDFTDTIRVKIFSSSEEGEELESALKKGTFIRVQGHPSFDVYDRELVFSGVRGIRKFSDFRERKQDTAEVRRVELHCHTKMSDMDGVAEAGDLIARAYEWGHPAIAITDHAVVQAFPDANKAMKKLDAAFRKAYEEEHPEIPSSEIRKVSSPFKVIYGCEAYLVDDLRGVAVHERGQLLRDSYVVFDIETTGLSNQTCHIIEIGAVRVADGEVRDRFSMFVNPGVPIPFHIEQLTGISDAMVEDAPPIEEVLPAFLEFCGDDALVAHNADFDVGFIRKACEDQGIHRVFTRVDTLAIAHFLLPQLSRFTLDRVAKALEVHLGSHHRAVDDAACTADIFVKFIGMLEERGIVSLKGLNEEAAITPHAVSRLRETHAVLLAMNETGRVNLYRLISEAHLHYIKGRAKFPKSLIRKYHEGILVGSACMDGEIYQALLSGASEEELAQAVSFYDYLEVQPVGNASHLIANEKEEAIRDEEDLRKMIRRIVKLGEQFKKPVAATGDVHYLDPGDVEYRRICKEGKIHRDRDEYDQNAFYFRTTDEMLEEFSFLGEKKAWEIVVENPRRIAEKIEKISPIRDGKFPPVIENSDKTLREICETKAHELYGPELPEIVSARLDKELNSIISNGYAVLYIIAQKLV
ncbi:MAG: PHP domain-containing protein, partial [Eubacterium sp.]|nr:PHP domain-containing protein [Eubacterium sp.]